MQSSPPAHPRVPRSRLPVSIVTKQSIRRQEGNKSEKLWWCGPEHSLDVTDKQFWSCQGFNLSLPLSYRYVRVYAHVAWNPLSTRPRWYQRYTNNPDATPPSSSVNPLAS
jgi:hypothetical protein